MKVKNIIMGIAVAAIAGVNVYKVNAEKTQNASFISLDNLEAEACCLIEITKQGWEEWCWCGGNQDCPCFDGWAKGTPFYR